MVRGGQPRRREPVRERDSQLQVLEGVDDDLVGSILGVKPAGDSEESWDLAGNDGDLRERRIEGFQDASFSKR